MSRRLSRNVKLRETHAQKLVPTGKPARFVIASVAGHAFLKFVDGQVFHHLREDQLACVHPLLSSHDAKPSGQTIRPKKGQIEKSKNRLYLSDKPMVASASRTRNRTAVISTNGAQGCANPQRQGLSADLADRFRPNNVVGGIPTNALNYSPAWDA
jgi:hypothetical protein